MVLQIWSLGTWADSRLAWLLCCGLCKILPPSTDTLIHVHTHSHTCTYWHLVLAAWRAVRLSVMAQRGRAVCLCATEHWWVWECCWWPSVLSSWCLLQCTLLHLELPLLHLALVFSSGPSAEWWSPATLTWPSQVTSCWPRARAPSTHMSKPSLCRGKEALMSFLMWNHEWHETRSILLLFLYAANTCDED